MWHGRWIEEDKRDDYEHDAFLDAMGPHGDEDQETEEGRE
jgi:hypothetical protein